MSDWYNEEDSARYQFQHRTKCPLCGRMTMIVSGDRMADPSTWNVESICTFCGGGSPWTVLFDGLQSPRQVEVRMLEEFTLPRDDVQARKVARELMQDSRDPASRAPDSVRDARK